MLHLNWDDQTQKLGKTIATWAPRVLDNIRDRAEALRVYALSQVWYRAQVLPLPKTSERKISEQVAAFLWRGQISQQWHCQ